MADPYRVSIFMHFIGITKKGQGRGKELGFPTVNIELQTLEYEEGVFAVRGKLNEKNFQGIAHFGPRPTFDDKALSVEIHIFDFVEEVNEGTKVEFESVGKKIRGVRKFGSAEELQKQISQDVFTAHKLLYHFSS